MLSLAQISAALILQNTNLKNYAFKRYMWIVEYSGACMVACSTVTVGLRSGNNTAKRTQELGVGKKAVKQNGCFSFMNRGLSINIICLKWGFAFLQLEPQAFSQT